MSMSENLTPMQYKVVYWVAKGYSVKEVARLLDLSPKTVDKHKSNLKRNLGIRGGVKWMMLLREFPGP